MSRSGTGTETVCFVKLCILSISVQIGICTGCLNCSITGLWNHNTLKAPYNNEFLSVWAPFIVHCTVYTSQKSQNEQDEKCLCSNGKRISTAVGYDNGLFHNIMFSANIFILPHTLRGCFAFLLFFSATWVYGKGENLFHHVLEFFFSVPVKPAWVNTVSDL